MKKLIFLVLLLINCSQEVKINADTFSAKISSTDINLIDVRTYEEFASGHIPNAINIDFNNFEEFKKNIDLVDKNKPTYIYCMSGGRSSKAFSFLSDKGFNNLFELNGGIMEWRKGKFPENNLLNSIDEFSLNEFYDILDVNKLVMISFNAKWCAPCIKMKPTLKKLSNENISELLVVNIDYNRNKKLMNELQIYSLPLIQFYKNNKLVYEINEFLDEGSIRDIIDNLI